MTRMRYLLPRQVIGNIPLNYGNMDMYRIYNIYLNIRVILLPEAQAEN